MQTDIKEVVHYPTDKASRIVHAQGSFGFDTRRRDQLYPDVDECGDNKGVYEITLKCGFKIALDLAGAQWELSDGEDPHLPVTLWSDYWHRWGFAVKYRVPFRSHQLKHSANMESHRLITSQTLMMEISLYFNIFMVGGCKAELGFAPSDLLDMDLHVSHDAKQRFFNKVNEHLQRRPQELDSGRGLKALNVLGRFDLRHPKVIAERSAAQPKGNGSLPLEIGSMKDFDWKELSGLIRMSGSEVSLNEKKRARALQKKRCVYREPGSWKLVFLEDTIPSSKVPVECVSENSAWKLG